MEFLFFDLLIIDLIQGDVSSVGSSFQSDDYIFFCLIRSKNYFFLEYPLLLWFKIDI